MNGERVDAAFQFAGQRRVNHTVAFEPALPAESARHNIKPKVRLASGPMSCVSLMKVRFIFDMHTFGREGRQQLCRDNILHPHLSPPYGNRVSRRNVNKLL